MQHEFKGSLQFDTQIIENTKRDMIIIYLLSGSDRIRTLLSVSS